MLKLNYANRYSVFYLRQNVQKENKMKKKLLFSMMLVCLIGLLFVGCGGDDSDETTEPAFSLPDFQYTNNDSEALPIKVTDVNIADSFYSGFVDLTLETENVTDKDYREATFAMLAWDNDGFPIQLDYANDGYIKNPYLENVAAYEIESNTWQYNTEEFGPISEIGYMAIFLAEYTDFDGETWVNPVLDYITLNQGQKIEDYDGCYYTFE